MSKVLKFIVHLVVICTLICVLGLVLPPFFGVKTVIVDKAGEETNLPVGSVTYAIPQKTAEVSEGTPILVQKDSRTYKYTITNLDTSKGTGTVTDQSVSGGKTLTVKVGNYVPKVVITIGFIGYLLVATQSIEGLIIMGLVVLFLIILYVIAELWKKEPDDDRAGKKIDFKAFISFKPSAGISLHPIRVRSIGNIYRNMLSSVMNCNCMAYE